MLPLEWKDSRALLIGCREYDSSRLPDLPTVSDTLHDLRLALEECCGMRAEQIDILDDRFSAREIGLAIAEAAEKTKGVLLLYYVGHGLISNAGDLFISAADTDGRPNRLPFDSLRYQNVRESLLESPAKSIFVIIDACYSGRALDVLSGDSLEDQAADLSQVDGACVFVAASRNELALAPRGKKHTAFTGEIISYLRYGEANTEKHLTVRSLVRAVSRALPGKGLPRPRSRMSEGIDGLILAENPARISPASEGLLLPDSAVVTRLSRVRTGILMLTVSGLIASALVIIQQFSGQERVLNVPSPERPIPNIPITDYNMVPMSKTTLDGFIGRMQLSSDGSRLYVPVIDSDAETASIQVVDSVGGVVDKLPIPSDVLISEGFTLSPDGEILYYSDRTVGETRAINVASKAIVGKVPGVVAEAMKISASQNGERLLVSGDINESNTGLAVIDTRSMTLEDAYPMPGNVFAGLAASADGYQAFLTASAQGTSSVGIIEIFGRGLSALVPLGDDAYAFDVATNVDETLLLVAATGLDEVIFVDPRLSVKVSSTHIDTGAASMHVVAAANRAFFCGPGGLSVMDISRRAVIATAKSLGECRQVFVFPGEQRAAVGQGKDLLMIDLPAF